MKVIITEPAKKDLSKLDDKTRARILAALERMAIRPDAADLKKLQGEQDIWRLRVGDWRVILQIMKDEIMHFNDGEVVSAQLKLYK